MTKYTSKGLKKGSAQLDQLGNYLIQEVSNSQDASNGLVPRWEQNEGVYRNEPELASVRLYDNFDPRPIPVMSSRINRIVDVTVRTLTSPTPILQAIPDDKDQSAADVLERGLEATWDIAKFERYFRRALTTAALCGVSVLRMRMAKEGLRFDHIHPRDFIIGPTYGLDMKDAHMVGHRFYIPRWKLKDRVKEGGYNLVDMEWAESAGPKSPDEEPAGRNPEYDLNEASNYTTEADNELVELWELLIQIELDGSRKWCRVVFHQEDGKVLLKESYPYTRPWYFDVRFHDEEGKWWPANSIAQNIIGLCYLQSDMFNLMAAGSMATAVSPTVISNGSLGAKVKNLSLGHVYQSPYDIKVQQIPLSFDPKAMPLVQRQIDDLIESQTGIFNNRLMQDRKSGDVTATQIAAEEQAASQNEGTYPAFASDTLEEMAHFWHELIRSHPGVLRAVYGERIPEQFYGKSWSRVRWVSTGKSPGNAPQFLVGKLQALYTMSRQPGSVLHAQRTEKALVNSMDVPINVEGIIKTDEEMAQEQAQAAAMAAQEMAQSQGGGSDAGIMGGVGPEAGMGIPG